MSTLYSEDTANLLPAKYTQNESLYDAPSVPRQFSRTPSPTPSEINFLNGVKEKRSMRENIVRYAIIAVLIAIAVLISVFHTKIINALRPETDWLASHPAGFLIPIALLVILSFPPLFGHEIVAILVGVTWNLPAAFGIVAAGTLLGEFANYFTFKYFCTARGEKLEKSNLSYGVLALVVRNGGFWVVLIMRYSAIPGHFSTMIFSTVGISFFVYAAAAVLSLPKNLVPVYIGYAMKHNDSTSEKVEKIILVITILVTVLAMVWIRRMEERAKPAVVYARRKARQAKLWNNESEREINNV